MSKKKEKRIKRLRKYSLWPQIIETVIVEIAFIIAVSFVMVIDLIAENHDLVTRNAEVCATIVEYVNQGWDSSTSTLKEDYSRELSNFVKYDYETIGAINIVDNDLNSLAVFGQDLLKDSSFERHFDSESYDENGFFYSGSSSKYEYLDPDKKEIDSSSIDSIFIDDPDFEDDFYPKSLAYTEEDSVKMFLTHFFSKRDSLTTRSFYDWAVKKDGYNSLWIMYKSDFDGVNVAIKKRSIQTQIDMSRHIFMIIMLLIIFAFICLYEHYKLIMIIIQRRKIQKIIWTDSVTGGYNKDYLIAKGARLVKKQYRSSALVYLRMEKFRNYGTAYGIKASDNLMEDFYKKLQTLIKKRKELAVHLEKGDFAMLLHFDNKELLDIRMQAITQALNDCRPEQHLFFSVGACRINTRADILEEKISNAAAAISQQEGKTANVFWFDESMREEQIWERRVEDDMDKALENNEFKVYLQPKYSTKKEQLSAAEALVRWIHPEYGFVSPAKFIPIFERNGFITKLDDFMLTEVSKLQAKWLGEGLTLVPISVNVSRAHFSQYDLAEHICAIVDAYKVPHEYIELELTESAFFDDKQILLDTIKKLKSYGFKVSMDDFGAGYSSLNSLKELPLDIIKLDAQFFRDIEDKKRADLIVCDTIKLAKKLGMQIVAEGIETREQVDFLAEQHCDLIQGFYFAKPLPVDEFEEKAFIRK